MKVKDLMIRDVATVCSTDGLDHAARTMRDRGCGCVVVVAEDKKLAGVLTDRDVCMAALHEEARLDDLSVAAAMSTQVHTCGPDDSIADAERLMGMHQVRRLPVVDSTGRVEGIVALDDLARAARGSGELSAPPISSTEVGKTLGQITGPHLIIDTDRSP